jgi:hypothetical protein
MNDAMLHNTFGNDGYFGNPSNADFGQIVYNPGQPQNCFAGNVAPNGSAPADLEQAQPTCGKITTAADTGARSSTRCCAAPDSGAVRPGRSAPIRTSGCTR